VGKPLSILVIGEMPEGISMHLFVPAKMLFFPLREIRGKDRFVIMASTCQEF